MTAYICSEAKLYIAEIGPQIRSWYGKLCEPGELPKRINAAVFPTPEVFACLAYYPGATLLARSLTCLMPGAIDVIMHYDIVQGAENIIGRLNMSDTQKKIVTIAGVVISGTLIENPYLAILPAFFTAKISADAILNTYYRRT